MKRVYTLYRVSTVKQVDIVKDDIPMQRIACREFAERFSDWEILCEFEEKGVSGYKVSADNRDAIQDLKDAALKGEFDVLLVFMFDRLGRIENETPFVLQWFVDHGIEMWSANEGQQKIETHGDKLMNYIRFWQASGESEKTSIRVKTRLAQMTEEGLYTGGGYSYGYRLVASGRKNKKGHDMRDLAIEPTEAAIVEKVFRLVVNEGCGSHQISEMLNREGCRTHNGALFQSTTIVRMLKNPIYVGYIVNGGVRSERVESLRIVPDEIFERAQMIVSERARCNSEKRTIALSNQSKALLSGNIYCGHCGCRLATSRYKESYRRVKDGGITQTEYVKYVCYHRSRGLNDCDGASTYKADKIDGVILKLMKEIFARVSGCPDEEKIQAAYKKKMTANHHLQRKLEQELEKYKRQLEVLRSEISKSLAGESIFEKEDLTMSLHKLKADITEHEDKLSRLRDEDRQKKEIADSVVPAYKQFKTWAEEFEGACHNAKKMIACQLFSRVEVYKGYRISVKLNLTYKQFLEGWTTGDDITLIA